MTSDGSRRGPGATRLPVLCAVLLGLVLMHGSPASAASGCHGGMPLTVLAPAPAGHSANPAMHRAPGTHTPDATGHQAATATGGADTVDRAAPSAGRGPAAARVGGGRSGTGGASCLATPARGGPHLPPPGAGVPAVPPAVVLAGRSGGPAVPGPRGPPGGGRDLLLRVCVART